MKSFITFLCIAWLLSACSGNEKLPPDVLPFNAMKVIVWDLQIAEQQASERFTLQRDSLRMETTSLYGQVFAKHKIKKASFYKSFAFYESHPDMLKVLFDSVSNYGNRAKTAAYKKNY